MLYILANITPFDWSILLVDLLVVMLANLWVAMSVDQLVDWLAVPSAARLVDLLAAW